MSSGVNWLFTITFLNAILGFLVCAILFLVSSRHTFTAKLLGAFLFALNVLNLNMSLTYTDFFLRFPWMWRVLAPASFCIGPLAYLYVRSILRQSFRFKRSDLFMLVLPTLYMIQLYPLFMSPMAHKLEVVQRWMSHRPLLLQEPEGILPMGWAATIRVLYSAFFLALQFRMIFAWKKRIFPEGKAGRQNVEIYNWLIAISVALLSMYVLLLVEFVFHMSSFMNLNNLVLYTPSLTSLFLCFYLLARPNILYGLTGWLQEPEVDQTASLPSISEQQEKPAAIEPRRLTLSREQGRAYQLALETHFRKHHPYTKPGYTLGDLSAELKIPGHLLSAFINQEYGKNFNELINTYRVAYLMEMVQQKDDMYQYTLEALGRMAGFNSRTAFIAAVKKNTGRTPSELFNRKVEVAD